MREEVLSRVLKRLISGVYLLTCCRGEEINGMPVSWASQVSSRPPLVMVAVRPDRYSHAMIEASGAFALSLLGRGQPGLVDRFMHPGPLKAEKFQGLEVERGVTGCPLLRDAAGFLECRVVGSQRPGDHTLFLGEVVAAGWYRDLPLLSMNDYGHSYGG
ncbi:MAG: flavin reductase [Candidatus Tectomicrobia bacterium]|uniref:Flavin reductase n=1 Tax=Tectimicrobiota bacterium TaxID=2528274 RepID=A0A932FWI4_UNCTE|nr:flavin reductase [Candidatus Tectomicrobia bacterium]